MASLNPIDQDSIFAEDSQYAQGRYILLRHAKTAIDPLTPVQDWELDEIGKRQAKSLIRHHLLQSIDVIFCSPEKKARQTIEPFSKHFDIPMIELADLRESHLDQFYPRREEFVTVKEWKFRDPMLEIGESHHDAQNRIIGTIEGIRSYMPGKTVLITTHGTVISLYLEYLYGYTEEETIEKWKTMPYCYLEEIS